MADIIFIAVAVAFFALCVGYVIACDRIIGKRQVADPTTGADTDTGVTRP